jgi:hypothetical protein
MELESYLRAVGAKARGQFGNPEDCECWPLEARKPIPSND